MLRRRRRGRHGPARRWRWAACRRRRDCWRGRGSPRLCCWPRRGLGRGSVRLALRGRWWGRCLCFRGRGWRCLVPWSLGRWRSRAWRLPRRGCLRRWSRRCPLRGRRWRCWRWAGRHGGWRRVLRRRRSRSRTGLSSAPRWLLPFSFAWLSLRNDQRCALCMRCGACKLHRGKSRRGKQHESKFRHSPSKGS